MLFLKEKHIEKMNKKLTTFDCIAGACSLSKTKKINGINQIFKIKN